MPTNRKRIPHSRLAPPILPEHWALLNESEYPRDGNPFHRHTFLHAAPVLWAEHRETVLADWIAHYPGTRPPLWWRFDAPEPRREDGGNVEAEAAYLSRLGLLWPGELRRLRPDDMKPLARRLADL